MTVEVGLNRAGGHALLNGILFTGWLSGSTALARHGVIGGRAREQRPAPAVALKHYAYF